MPWFTSASKTVGRLLFVRRNSLRERNKLGYSMANFELGNFVQFQCLNGVAAANSFSSNSGIIGSLYQSNNTCLRLGNVCNYSCSYSHRYNNDTRIIQKRGFLGCGDGEEGSMLSKVYEERRILGYSPEQLFAVVAAVDLYEDFLPWCQRSEIIRRIPDGSFDAELEIGFKFLVESYVSHVELKKPKYIKTTASESGLFDHLINVWEFNPGPVPGSCNLHFLVDFKFQSPFYRQMANMFFKEVASRLVSSFNDRCRLIYGPGVQVLQNSYQREV